MNDVLASNTSADTVFDRDQPVSRTLELQVRRELKNGLVVWLDKGSIYTDFVDRLQKAYAKSEFDPVVGYRGSFLEMLFAFEGLGEGVENTSLLIHMPGFNEDGIRDTPILPYRRAGRRIWPKLEGLIESAAVKKVTPEEIQRYIATGPTSLAAADQWLNTQIAQNGSPLADSELEWTWQRLSGVKKQDGLPSPDDCLAFLRTVVSLDLGKTGYESLFQEQGKHDLKAKQYRTLADALAAWCMAVEYVSDLKREPFDPDLVALKGLNEGYREEALRLTAYLRTNYAPEYVRIAMNFEEKIDVERQSGEARDLGKIDTFRFEDGRMMSEALEKLIAGGHSQEVHEWAQQRRTDVSIWLREDRERANAWSLIRAAARLDVEIAAKQDPLAGVQNLDDVVVLYRDSVWSVDAAHREFEQRRRRYLQATLPNFSIMRRMLDTLRARYHVWAENGAQKFSEICEKEGRFLPSKSRQQREIFEQVVRPLINPEDRLAYLMLDGFRFEMAHELLKRLQDTPITSKTVDARLSELPSITAVGMNVLAPLADHGKLTPIIKSTNAKHAIAGFKTNTFQVVTPDNRRTAIYKRIGQSTCPLISLDEVLDAKNLKDKLKGNGIAVIHALDLDEAGEVGHGTAAFENILMRIASAIRQLREAGINRFVITSDHGFVLEPPTDTISMMSQTGARYRISETLEKNKDVVSVSLADLNYNSPSKFFVSVPRGIRCFDVGGKSRNYVHGGNSLQERVIPVVTLTYKTPSGGVSKEQYNFEAKHVSGVTNVVSLIIRRTQASLSFTQDALDVVLEPVEEGVELEIENVVAAEFTGESTINLQVGDLAEVYFKLRGAQDGRSQIRIVAVGRSHQIAPVTLSEYFTVVGHAATVPATENPVLPPTQGGNLDAIVDPGYRKVLEHIEKFDSITESEATLMLGSARKFRQFSREIETLKQYLSFDIRAEPGATGKRYVKS